MLATTAGTGAGAGPWLTYGGIGLALLLIFGLLALLYWLVRSQLAIRRVVAERFAGKNVLLVDRSAHFFGLESAGRLQTRGKGMLVLSDEELFFVMLITRGQIAIPLPLITGVENPRSFLGKSMFRPLLKVGFRTAQGGEDAVAWYIRDLENVQNQLERARRKQQP